MLHVQLDNQQAIGGALLDVLEECVTTMTSTSDAYDFLERKLSRSKVYKLKRETHETLVVTLNGRAVARVGVDDCRRTHV